MYGKNKIWLKKKKKKKKSGEFNKKKSAWWLLKCRLWRLWRKKRKRKKAASKMPTHTHARTWMRGFVHSFTITQQAELTHRPTPTPLGDDERAGISSPSHLLLVQHTHAFSLIVPPDGRIKRRSVFYAWADLAAVFSSLLYCTHFEALKFVIFFINLLRFKRVNIFTSFNAFGHTRLKFLVTSSLLFLTSYQRFRDEILASF